MEHLHLLVSALEAMLVRSPWSRQQSVQSWLDLTRGEAQEALECDDQHLLDELADTLWCVLSAILKHGGREGLESACQLAQAKIARRKPWLSGDPSGDPKTLADEVRIWQAAKAAEKKE